MRRFRVTNNHGHTVEQPAPDMATMLERCAEAIRIRAPKNGADWDKPVTLCKIEDITNG